MSADDGVVALSRWRAVLARSRSPRKRLELLLAEPNAAAVVARVPIEDLYYLVKGVGLADAPDVLRLASPEQLVGCLDLDLWDRDRLANARLFEWLEILAELPPNRLAALARELDAELLALIVGGHARIYDPTLREVPGEETPHGLYRAPDGTFVVEILIADATRARTLERFLDRLYRADLDFARMILIEAKWGTTAELEEESYRWRTARLIDMGFPPWDEAIGVYRLVDPGARRPAVAPVARDPSDPPTLPVPFAESLGGESFLGRVLAEIDDADLVARLSAGLVALLNWVLVADRVDPADLDMVREVSARGRDTISLGLEWTAEGDVARARSILEATPLAELFRTGYSLSARLGRRAVALDRAGVIDPSIDPLLEPRPLFPCALDPVPTAGARPFRSVADVAAVEAHLAGVEAAEVPG